MTENTIKWVAGLSNGETLVEGRGICEGDKEFSHWAKLQRHLKNNNLTINSFSLRVGDKHFNLPSSNPKFKGTVPCFYNCFRKYAGDYDGGSPSDNVEEYICAEAIYDDFTIQLWVDEHDHDKSWVNIIT